MAVSWVSEGSGFHTAEYRLGAGMVIHLLVERLDESIWDWQVWDPAQCLRADRGMSDTLEGAKVQAELAVAAAVACAEAELAEPLTRRRRSPSEAAHPGGDRVISGPGA